MGTIAALKTARSALGRFVRKRTVLSVSACAAVASMLAIPPDASYAGYFDLRTLACLFCVLAVAAALRRAGAFTAAARTVVRRFSTSRSAVVALVAATVVLSMFATNDTALIMMLPLATATLVRGGWAHLVPFAFTMMSLGANLGGMIMPFGNPQNLYLYSRYGIDLGAFLGTMAVPFAVSMALVFACCFVYLRKRPGCENGDDVSAPSTDAAAAKGDGAPERPAGPRTIAAYAVLFVVVIGSVVRLVPVPLALALVIVALALLDRTALRGVDYALLLTFVCFFVFAGNLARIPAVDAAVGGAMSAQPLLTSAGLSQVISNVPAAVLLSHFTDAWQPLLVGVNIGGAGTPVGSLASLITIQHFMVVRRHSAIRAARADSVGAFMKLFVGLNVAFLAVLAVASAPFV